MTARDCIALLSKNRATQLRDNVVLTDAMLFRTHIFISYNSFLIILNKTLAHYYVIIIIVKLDIFIFTCA